MASRKGTWAEDAACSYLEARGLQILQRNWKSGHFEVDIIATSGELLLFIEVKQREMNFFGRPSEAVDSVKRQRLVSAAEQYLAIFAPEANGRMDIVEVFGTELQHRIHWIPEAF